MHTILLDAIPPATDHTLTVRGDEARHAIRVKRLREGATLRLVDGQGHVCLARITAARRDLELALLERSTEPSLTPAIELCSATPKGPRLDKMIDQLSQIGVATWRPMNTAYGVVDPGAGKLDRMARIVAESAKQAARAWLMKIAEPITFADAIAPADGQTILLADASGEPYSPTGSQEIRILIGPEGGFTDDERQAARAAGARLINLAPHTLRIETAAAAAATIVLHEELRARNMS
ncbi:MAG: 16S rRNA (uracil(1498)-N(3))-methyltransferase [Phycisphaerales bacterium]|nr:16S rRNA (uracil(1498)-N(3))-methyltransferase [Phycisphaerales bacterium]